MVFETLDGDEALMLVSIVSPGILGRGNGGKDNGVLYNVFRGCSEIEHRNGQNGCNPADAEMASSRYKITL